jgi:hypothetical protein
LLSQELIEKIVSEQIKLDKNVGQQAGGSGHLGYVSYRINQIDEPIRAQFEEKNVWKITYTYTITVETEFTYYPDNPPKEYKYQKILLVDNTGKVVKDYGKTSIGESGKNFVIG